MTSKTTKLLTWVFDCDGVLLDSNQAKTYAFEWALRDYPEDAVTKFIRHHKLNGGLSRFEKVDRFFREILKRRPGEDEKEEILNRFALRAIDSVMAVDEAPQIRRILPALRSQGMRLIVVSGGAQSEVRGILEKKNLSHYFDGVFGSPDSKSDILFREISDFEAAQSLFIGDSPLDYMAAVGRGMSFAFVYDWTEFVSWREFFSGKPIGVYRNISEIFTHYYKGQLSNSPSAG